MQDRKQPLAPTGKLPPQPWMEFAETRAVVAALGRDGAEVRFVGGCVRDALAQRPVNDIDLATHDPPEKAIALLDAAGIRAIPTGIAHGTVTAVIGERHFEITTLRIDVETDGRRAKVAFTDDWAADAARRDFTINAMSCSPAGDIYDPFDGMLDLAQGRIRFVGRAVERIQEDALRLLRFFRFYATFGRPPLDPDALSACRGLAPLVDTLSGERVRAELFRILLAPDPAATVSLMQSERVLERVLPEAGDIGRLRVEAWLTTTALKLDGLEPDALRRLAALARADHAGALRIAARLKFSNAERDRFALLAAPPGARAPQPKDPAASSAPGLSSGRPAPPGALGPEMDVRARRRAFHELGSDVARDLALLAWSEEIAKDSHLPPGRNDAWTALVRDAMAWTPVQFPVKGRDALALGIPAGERMGVLLHELERWWIEGDFRAGREECLAELKEMFTATR
ncbi:MAG: CCA tRNA nucleotidyltransferase [Rhodospirillales bacterium]|nr:CCA tRNA nucleotidyltransferase [Rhodospirillales bacterium]MSP79763.1 CCA tRNA nucleotidyltransferase [Rhodospirillales bacterium]